MFDVLAHYIAKPFLGLITVIRLIGGGNTDSNDPSIESLTLIRQGDSVFVQVVIHDGVTQKIRELADGGVAVKTACTFSCGAFSRQWERKMQYNPVKQRAASLSTDKTGDGVFDLDSLDDRFNHLSFFLADREFMKKMQSVPAKLVIASSIKIDALEIGEKSVWPEKVVADFIIPAQ